MQLRTQASSLVFASPGSSNLSQLPPEIIALIKHHCFGCARHEARLLLVETVGACECVSDLLEYARETGALPYPPDREFDEGQEEGCDPEEWSALMDQDVCLVDSGAGLDCHGNAEWNDRCEALTEALKDGMEQVSHLRSPLSPLSLRTV